MLIEMLIMGVSVTTFSFKACATGNNLLYLCKKAFNYKQKKSPPKEGI
jgi:hypothetical protein